MENNDKQQPAIMIRNQYIKDMSLEIPLAPAIFKDMNTAPQVNVDFHMKHNPQDDGSHEIVLEAKMNAKINDKVLFILELSYAALADLNVAPEQIEPVMYIELPRLLFPFVRSVIANSLSEAGLPPMMLTPIDFVALYNARKAQEANNNSANA